LAKASRGEVWLVSLPTGQGHEQQGERPAIILAEMDLARVVTLVPITSSPAASKFPHTFKLIHSKENGLQTDSTVLVFQVTTIDINKLVHKLGELSEKDQKTLDALLTDFLKI